jgi:diphthamide biosynthesis methyltransferase
MTPKEKAKELVDKYEFVYIQNYTSMFEVKECALIAVDEIIDLVKHIDVDSEDYWEQVKQEIINL